MLVLDCGYRDVDIVFERLNVLSDVHLGSVDKEVNIHKVVRAPCAEVKEIVKVC